MGTACPHTRARNAGTPLHGRVHAIVMHNIMGCLAGIARRRLPFNVVMTDNPLLMIRPSPPQAGWKNIHYVMNCNFYRASNPDLTQPVNHDVWKTPATFFHPRHNIISPGQRSGCNDSPGRACGNDPPFA